MNNDSKRNVTTTTGGLFLKTDSNTERNTTDINLGRLLTIGSSIRVPHLEMLI